MRWVRSAACCLDGRVPPRVAEEDVIGGGQVEAAAARLQRHQHHRRAVGGLEGVDHRAAIAGAAVQARERQVGLGQRRLDRDRAGWSTARRRAPCDPRRPRSSSASSSTSSLDEVGAVCPGTSAGWHAAWRRRSSTSSACITPPPLPRAGPGSPSASPPGRRRRRRARASPSSTRSTASVRGGSSGATSCFRRRSRNGFIRARRRRRGAGLTVGDRAGVAIGEVRPPAEQPAVGEVHQAPQLLEPVLDRGAGQRQPRQRPAARRRRARSGCPGS